MEYTPPNRKIIDINKSLTKIEDIDNESDLSMNSDGAQHSRSIISNQFHRKNQAKLSEKTDQINRQSSIAFCLWKCIYQYCLKTCLIIPLCSMIILLCPSCHAFSYNLTTIAFLFTQFCFIVPQIIIESVYILLEEETYKHDNILGPIYIDFWILHITYIIILIILLILLPNMTILSYIRESLFYKWGLHLNKSDKYVIFRLLLYNYIPLIFLESFPIIVILFEHLYYNNINQNVFIKYLIFMIILKILSFFYISYRLILLLFIGKGTFDYIYDSNAPVYINSPVSSSSFSIRNKFISKTKSTCKLILYHIFSIIIGLIISMTPYVPFLIYIIYQQTLELKYNQQTNQLRNDINPIIKSSPNINNNNNNKSNVQDLGNIVVIKKSEEKYNNNDNNIERKVKSIDDIYETLKNDANKTGVYKQKNNNNNNKYCCNINNIKLNWKVSYIIFNGYSWILFIGTVIWIDINMINDNNKYTQIGELTQSIMLFWFIIILWETCLFTYFSWRLSLVFLTLI